MPRDRYNIKNDFQRFSQWWKNEVFSYALKEDGSLLPALKNLTLDDDGAASEKGATSAAASMDSSEGKKVSGKLDDRLKVLARIVGRFVGLLSVVQVSKTTKLSPIRVEARTEGQTIWYIGKRFSDIVLTPRQRDYMDREDRLGYLSGPPGSGKTVVLAVRGQK
ncbi:hypothetical protein PoB_002873200 [Plakobranchus ocellatus]|uniref:Uncharacterized protein n=1 Tax=Plakobranchus ocellatus TaxID=259542 RepID=A0AAV4A4M6_9GAST|nr:hypothetical protein PoB_002873200 [Plakobranchus ocellatus]